jgi:two-component system cell cycle sensor histidine kinase/response regulator CckA
LSPEAVKRVTTQKESLLEKTREGARILVVEDEAIIGMAMEEMLQKAGYRVTTVAVSATEALLAVQLSKPDLVLMDIHIRGELDGVGAANRIREEFCVPVIFVTGHADEETLGRARMTEPFGYLMKPISALSLTSSIEIALYKHNMERRVEENQAFLATILQRTPDAMIVTDMEGKTAFVNLAAEQLTGCNQSAMLGEHVKAYLHLRSTDGTEFTAQVLGRAIAGCEEVALPAGTTLARWDRPTAIPVQGQVAISYTDKRPAGAVFTLREVSLRAAQPAGRGQKLFAVGQFLLAVARTLLGIAKLPS